MNRRDSVRLSRVAIVAIVALCALNSTGGAALFVPETIFSRSEFLNKSDKAESFFSNKLEISQRRQRRNGPRFRRPQRRNDCQFQSPPAEAQERRRIKRLRNEQRRNRDQDNARDAVKSGAALPLSSIIQGVQASCPGRFLGARLIRRGDQLAYRLNILRPSGQRVTMFVDAANGNVVRGGCR